MTNSSNQRHRLLFLTVNCSYSHSSLALPLLHSACRDLANWEWLRYDMTCDGDIISAVRDITDLHCDLLAADLYLFNQQTVMEILQRCHTLDPACRIVVGGPEALGEGADILLQRYSWLDRVFRGEGEDIFRDYLEHFDGKSAAAERIVPAQGNAVYENWANSAYPASDGFFAVDKPFVQIETSRGCPMRCCYCTSGGTVTRYRRLEQVREELQLLQQRGVKEVRVLDRTFNLPQERGAALLKMFRCEFPDMRFHLELHPQFLNTALREELQQALPGQLHIEAGIQCLDDEVLKLSGRNSDSSRALEGLAYLARSKAFETHADLLAGLPGQTWEDILSDTNALININSAEIQLEVLKALPGTPLRRIAAEHGILYSAFAPYDVMQTNTMSLTQIQYARDLSRLLDLTYNHHFLHPAVLAMNEECNDLAEQLLNFFHQKSGSANVVWDLKKRFLFLLDFCTEQHLERAQNSLAYQWLLAGFPVGQGPDKYSRKTAEIPPEAVLCAGDAACRDSRESRYWVFPAPEQTFYLAYNRSYALNRPAAIWVKENAQ